MGETAPAGSGRTGERRALVLGDAAGRADRFVSSLLRSGVDARRTERAAEALPAVLEGGTDLLVVALPLRGAERVLAALRLRGSASLRAGALVVGAGDGHEDTDLALGRMANRLLPPTCTEEEFARAATTLLSVEPRVDPRGGARLRVLNGAVDELEVANLSASGLLVRARDPLPLGAVFGFTLDLDGAGEPVRGQAQVVRITRPATEIERGFAARFLTIGGEGGERLRSIVERHRANSNEPRARRPSGAEALPDVPLDPEACRRELAELEARIDELLRRGLTRRPGATDWYLTGAELGLESLRAFGGLLEPLYEDRAPDSEAARRIEDLAEVRRRLGELARAGDDLGARVRLLVALRPAIERLQRALSEPPPGNPGRLGMSAQTGVEIRRLVGTRRGLERLRTAVEELRSPRFVVAPGAARRLAERIRADYGGVAAVAGIGLGPEDLETRAGARRLSARLERELAALRRRIASLHQRLLPRLHGGAAGDAEADLLDPQLHQAVSEMLVRGLEYLARARAAYRHALEAAGADPGLLDRAERLAEAAPRSAVATTPASPRAAAPEAAAREAPSFGGVGPSWSVEPDPRHRH